MRVSGKAGLALRLACSNSKTWSGTSLVLLIATVGVSSEQFESDERQTVDSSAPTRLASLNSC